jgi:3-hydroxyisobutyrate dehydrogenase-like beta-hydroxyacid dehydrogenase
MTCLPSVNAVKDVYFHEASALTHVVERGTIIIEHSTIPPDLAREVGQAFAHRGAVYVEAPLFGGVVQAQEGSLFLALSGSEHALQDGEPVQSLLMVLTAIARGWSWVGGPGSAMLTKVLQNGLGLVQLAAMAETAAACRLLGVDPKQFYEVVTEAGGMAASPLFQQRFPLMLRRDAPVEARLAIAAKDAQLCCDLTRREQAGVSLFAATAEVFSAAGQCGLADEDVTAVWRVYDSLK